MRTDRPVTIRRGYSLIELLVAMVAASVLVAGLSSSIYVALKAADTSHTPTIATIEANAGLGDLQSDIQFALSLSEKTATAVTFTVPDRNADSIAETIRYEWSGVPGNPLTRRYNSGTVTELVSDVHGFGLTYYQPTGTVEYVNVWIQVSNDPQASIETSIPLLNRP